MVVPGTYYRSAWKFVKSKGRRIYLKCEEDNRDGSAVIKVIARTQGWLFERQKCIGYIPDDVANKLVSSGTENKVKARLQLIDMENGEAIDIRINLLGPMNTYEQFYSTYRSIH